MPGGALTDPFRPESIMSIEELAGTLANICRWGGRCRPFYSVAQHSALLAQYLLDDGHGPDVAFEALMHDIGEAYLMDIPAPIKSSPEHAAVRAIEERLDAYLLPLYGASWPITGIVDKADKRISHTEALSLGLAGNWLENYPAPLDIAIHPLEPTGAKEFFMSTHSMLIESKNALRSSPSFQP